MEPTTRFFRSHPVFNLNEAQRGLGLQGEKATTLERLKYHLGRGRIRSVARGVYATVPAGVDVEGFHADPFLVAAAARPDAVFSHHAALELLGAARSAWREVTVYTKRRRPPLDLRSARIRFLDHPKALVEAGQEELGLRRMSREDRVLRVTGPERTLVDGFRQPALAGGVEELVGSAASFPVLDLDLLGKVLAAYDSKSLWAAVGWFLERYQNAFYVPDTYLEELEKQIPASPYYLARGTRGGDLQGRWNLIVPESVGSGREPDEP
ncbi:MAG: hypothetical protein SX243_06055 [Acidobacteriota bacterium]|nr:hypothetical protein [Acidobacteriota bacterium]